MRRQRNRPKMQEQENHPEEELNGMEVSKLSDIEFRLMIMRMFNNMKRT